ncbi:MAG TPA: hypothetical protein VEH52_09335 [Gaiellaceae bacterium]|jgi:hypothetical protein|nr:hypothetical protein [Gaiellaceae bacterium]
MSPQRRPVYWKPKYPTRSMRERAWTKREQEREEALKRSRGPSLLDRIRAKLSRGT